MKACLVSLILDFLFRSGVCFSFTAVPRILQWTEGLSLYSLTLYVRCDRFWIFSINLVLSIFIFSPAYLSGVFKSHLELFESFLDDFEQLVQYILFAYGIWLIICLLFTSIPISNWRAWEKCTYLAYQFINFKASKFSIKLLLLSATISSGLSLHFFFFRLSFD